MANYPYRGAVAGTATLVKGGFTQVFSLIVSNRDASERWLQMFDAKAAADVTLGTTAPKMAIPIPASSTFFWDVKTDWQLGLVIAVTTTETGATGASTAAVVNARIG
jgi:hypothetical protein